MATYRDHKRALEARNLLAYRQGYRGAKGGVEGAYRAARKAREAGAPLPTDRTVRPDLKQITRLGTGTRRLVRGRRMDDPVVMGQLARATGRVRLKVTTSDGKVHHLLSKGGWNAQAVRDAIDTMGLDAFVADQMASAYGDDAGGGDVSSYELDLM